MNREEIEKCIPHRTPFLWIDTVVEISEKKIHARMFLDPSLDVFAGHFPQHPVLPGVLHCEMAFQAAAVLMSQMGVAEEGQIPVATRLNNVRFRRMILPGETVDIEVELTERLSNAFYLSGRISVDGRTATRLDLACTLADAL